MAARISICAAILLFGALNLEEQSGQKLMTKLFATADEWKEQKLPAAGSKIKAVLAKHIQ